MLNIVVTLCYNQGNTCITNTGNIKKFYFKTLVVTILTHVENFVGKFIITCT